jgi:glutamate dehydrogenase (NAD(P)+)
LLHEQGAVIRAVSDVRGGVLRSDGLDIGKLLEHVGRTGSVVDFPGAENISNDALLVAECAVLVPAALGHVLTQNNARNVRAPDVLEAANVPTTREADDIFNERGIVCVPDIYANAGGVTVSYFEWTQITQKLTWTEAEVNERLERIMVDAHRHIAATMSQHRCSMRTAAFVLGVSRVKDATDLRGLG